MEHFTDTSGQHFANQPALVPFAQARICAAIDVSTSTTGYILSQEVLAISDLCCDLTNEAKEKVQVLPWSGTAHSIVGLSDVTRLQNSYGTCPSMLCLDGPVASALKDASIWLLLTDGQVEEAEVQRFAAGIADQGLHGTACVVIMFDIAPSMPWQLNVSVGTAVFAVVPNCLFLFHDILTGDLYILQCKGCFASLLPPGFDNPALSSETPWHDLPRVDYKRLSQIEIPEPIKLSSDQLALSDGMIINMTDLYQDRLDRDSVTRIFANDDSLKTVLMTAVTRGRQAEVEAWLEKQKRAEMDSHSAVRPDQGGQARVIIKKLLDLLDREHAENDIIILREKLQAVHAINWSLFESSLHSPDTRVNHLIRDSKVRMDSMSPLGTPNPYSPSILAPISSAASFQPWANPQSNESMFDLPKSPRPPRSHASGYQISSGGQLLRYPFPTQPYASGFDPPGQASSRASYNQSLCFTPGYHREPRGLSGLCQLCGKESSPIALLLKKADPNEQTEGFPPPNGRAKQAYPLAMGNFPETDIISKFICCDPCSFFVKQIGRAPSNQNISGALLITNWVKNLDLFISAIDSALEHRFSQTDILPLFLAILYTTKQDVKSDDHPCHSPVLNSAIDWLIDGIERTISLSLGSLEPTPQPAVGRNNMGFRNELKDVFEDACKLQGPALTYPLEGFTVLVYAAQNNFLDPALISRVVYLKYLYCSIDQFYATERANGGASLRKAVDRLFGEKSQSTSEVTEEAITELSSEDSVSSAVSSFRGAGTAGDIARTEPISISSLRDGPLLTEDTVLSFDSMGESFKAIEKVENDLIGPFLNHLLRLSRSCTDPVICFRLIQAQEDMQEIMTKLVGTNNAV